MNLKLITLALLLICNISNAAEPDFSEPIEIPKYGWNKILQLENGNTILFHFEARQPIITKIFDSTRKEISSKKYSGDKFNILALEESIVHGIYEINGEPTVFISQERFSHNTLFVLRFDPNTGKLLEEKLQLESTSFKNKISFNVVSYPQKGGYIVFCMKDLAANYKETLNVNIYNNKHNLEKQHTLNINSKDYDYISHISTSIANNGSIMIALSCSKIIQYPSKFDKELYICYIPLDKEPSYIITKIDDKIRPYYSNHTYNNLKESINLFLTSSIKGYKKNGLEKIPVTIYESMLLQYNSNKHSEMSIKYLQNALSIKHSKENNISINELSIAPRYIHTNKYGKTTIISEGYSPNIRYNNETLDYNCHGNIYVTRLNNSGQEIWGTCISKKQVKRCTDNAYGLFTRETYKALFRCSSPNAEWNNQLVSFYPITTKRRNLYIIYNDTKSNFYSEDNNTDSVYNFSNTSAVYYKIGRKNEIEKELLFEATSDNETYISLLESSSYDKETDTYAVLLLHKVGDIYEQIIGWRKLDDLD